MAWTPVWNAVASPLEEINVEQRAVDKQADQRLGSWNQWKMI